MDIVTVYSKNNCPACRMTKKALDRKKIQYNEVNLDDNPDVRAELAEEGFLAAPVVKTADMAWAGYNIANIEKLEAQAA